MPLYESACKSEPCPEYGNVVEWIGKYEDADPLCICGSRMERQISRFGVIWTGPITNRYLDRSLENSHGEGSHWAYRTKDTKDGKPEPVLIETWQDQREYCKQEGLALPQDTSSGMISSDGMHLKPVSAKEANEYRAHSNEVALKEAAQQEPAHA